MHNNSKDHIHSHIALKLMKKNKNTIKDALEENAALSKKLFNDNVRKNRLILEHLIDVTILLAKQELAFHGHDERNTSANRGNFKEIFNMVIKRNSELNEHLKTIGNIFNNVY